eukprot:CAMPEP_0116967150 /NCGR_PEP_ID=MMETSP0467-20121206/50357_1 /TAXON_ID=283647 /ORGANISM="Mesodinium pulex, Strain SPMC105" /LENGTH=37 /DNA_ID= /DNA_START= /DNA_END= /DNA_ORIENTATION=
MPLRTNNDIRRLSAYTRTGHPMIKLKRIHGTGRPTVT